MLFIFSHTASRDIWDAITAAISIIPLKLLAERASKKRRFWRATLAGQFIIPTVHNARQRARCGPIDANYTSHGDISPKIATCLPPTRRGIARFIRHYNNVCTKRGVISVRRIPAKIARNLGTLDIRAKYAIPGERGFLLNATRQERDGQMPCTALLHPLISPGDAKRLICLTLLVANARQMVSLGPFQISMFPAQI